MSQLKNLETLFALGKITRREFLVKAFALGLATAVSPTLLKSAALASTPKRGGRVRAAWTIASPTETLDPALSTASMDYCRVMQFYNTLVWVTPDMEPIPELAESWEATPDAKTWYFKLRKGVTFQSGKELEANDVIFSIQRIIAKDSKSGAKKVLSEVAEVKAEDKYTVKIVLSAPNADLPMMFVLYQAAIVQEGTEKWDEPAGTGPYLLKEFKPGRYSVAKRNPNYFKEGKPYFDELEWFAIPDNVARVNALISGDVHMAGVIAPKLVKQIESSPGVRPLVTKAGQYCNFVMMCDRPPFNNPDLRMAFKYLPDRDRILKTVYNSHGTIGNDNPIGPAHRFFCKDLPVRTMDLEKAKYYFKKAGAEGGSFDLHYADVGPGIVDQVLMLQQQAAKVGVKVNPKLVPADGYWNHTWIKKSFHVSNWNPRPTVDIQFSTTYKTGSPYNENQWSNKRFDQLLIDGRGELDDKKRQEIYCECQRIVRDESGTILPSFIDYIDGVSDKIKGIVPVPLAGMGAHKFVETGWLDE